MAADTRIPTGPSSARASVPAPGAVKRPRLEAAFGWLGLTGLAVLLMAGLLVVQQTRARVWAEAETQVSTDARVLAQHTARIFDAADLLVAQVGEEARQRSWDAIQADRALWERLRRLNQPLPFIDSIWLNDESGLLRLTTFAFPAPYSNAADRDAFLVPRSGVREPFVGGRIIGRVTKEPTFLLSRRLEDDAGAFRGIASITIEPDYFASFVEEMQRSFNPALVLFRETEKDVLLRYPADGGGDPAPLTATQRNAVEHPAGAGLVHGDRYLFAYRQVGRWPLFVGVQVDTAAVDAAWRSALVTYVPLGGMAAAALLLLSAFGFRQARLARRIRLDLEESVRVRTRDLENALADLRETLAERDGLVAQKDLLMREVNHRVKNSLHLVSSLLTLQAGSADNPAVRTHLDAAGRRVRAVSDIHSLLYRDGNVSAIPLHDYIAALCREVEESIRNEGGGWSFDLDLDPVEVPADRAVTLGLVVNELVINAVKHAYPPARHPAGTPKPIHVGLKRRGDGWLVLTVADRGVGMPEGVDWTRSRSLGMRVVHTLARQIGAGRADAGLSVERTAPGTAFTLTVAPQTVEAA